MTADEESAAPLRALVAGAHPDDCEFACGGTVAKWTGAGVEVALVVVTDGSLGFHDTAIPDAKLVQTREREQAEAAEVLGLSTVRFLGRPDGDTRADRELIDVLARTIRELRPERLLTHDAWKLYMLHPDHVEVGRAVVRAAIRAREPRVDLEPAFPAWRPDELWLFRAEQPNHVEGIRAWLSSSSFARSSVTALNTRHR